ncbi:hypothetical protein M885DRAFT_626561 [Pelagophyceae sp. CCMP2097]|nr:hypothetical protein M885DRAFT_626561 [Pelagophyceae sp. CCMP2097]
MRRLGLAAACLVARAASLAAPRPVVRAQPAVGAQAGWKYDLDAVERSLMTERDNCGVGFVVESNLPASRRVVLAALEAVTCVEHRGACSADGISGDGAGLLTAIPWAVYDADTPLLKAVSEKASVGCAMLFLPRDAEQAAEARALVDACAAANGFDVVAWRAVPLDAAPLGEMAAASRPTIEQVFVKSNGGWTGVALEKALYFFRRAVSGSWAALGPAAVEREELYFASCSGRTVVYKGMCQSAALPRIFLDLADDEYVSKFAIYHRRFSTNTLPRWSLAQPFRLLAHNGEINTIRGNVNWMAARAVAAGGDLGLVAACGDDGSGVCARVDVRALGPVVDAAKSDSANLDACCELYTRGGRSVAESLMVMIPPAATGGVLEDFFAAHAPLQEPWDGPAGVCFADGSVVGARLDRNGLRPARYTRYKDGLVTLSSETGAAARAVPGAGDVVEHGRLGPGETCVVDLNSGGFFTDDDVRLRISKNADWTKALGALGIGAAPRGAAGCEQPGRLGDALARHQTAFGWGAEDVDMQVVAMIQGAEATFCMGADAPLAVLSAYAHPLYDYLKQRHAQVTNPPIDALRERHVMTLDMWLGERPNSVDVKAGLSRKGHAAKGETRLVKIESPVVDASQLAALEEALGAVRVSTVFAEKTLEAALASVVADAVEAVRGGARLVVLTDADFSVGGASYVPPLLAVGAVHHGLIASGLRLDASLVVETAQCWSTHHVASLVGYGASAVRPYLLFETARAQQAKLEKAGKAKAGSDPVQNCRKALDGGVLKIMSKMGISALSSYHGAQTFEAIGLGADVVSAAFKGTPSRIGGMSLADVERETRSFVAAAAGGAASGDIKVFKLENYGFANSLAKGEVHANSPKVARLLHSAVRDMDGEFAGDEELLLRRLAYDEFARTLRETSPVSLRDLVDFVQDQAPSAADADLAEITRRFVTGGMSLGALSREAHETLAIAMHRIGGASNSGEGGEDVDRDVPITAETRKTLFSHLRGSSVAAGDAPSSKIKQVASGRFGVTTRYLANADQIEIKIAQGAKPGEGGQLPGAKVDAYIASIRAATQGVTLISPPPHHDIYSIEDLSQLIFDLKAVNPTARVSVKLVSIAGIGTVACGCAKAGADVVQISGHDGGTGAAALTSIKHAGAPLELGLAEAHGALVENGLRGRITLRVDGGIRTGRDVVALALLGAEEFGFGTVAMVAAGCVMARVCHTNNCPVGVATQKESLRARARGEPGDVVTYFELVADDVRRRLKQLGLNSLAEAVGRVDLLQAPSPESQKLAKTAGLDLAYIVQKNAPAAWRAPDAPRAPWPLLQCDEHFDDAEFADSAERHVCNVDRAVGTRLAGRLARRQHAARVAGAPWAAPETTLRYAGSAGQSFGAFATAGMQLHLSGDANDYVGKGLCGATLAIRPPAAAEANGVFVAAESVIVGNTCLYGATAGALYAAGRAGERFGVRNSGADAVIEGAGDHACEYMTGGTVVVLGPTGGNVAAGMTGGRAFLYDARGDAERRVNTDSVEVKRVGGGDAHELKQLVEAHATATGSALARQLLGDWENEVRRFWRVAPPNAAQAEPAAAPAVAQAALPATL